MSHPMWYNLIMKMKNEKTKKRVIRRSHGAWFRDEIAIMEGRKSFTPDKTTAKGPVNLGPDGNSVLSHNRL